MEEAKLRKYEHALVISGVGVIAFGLWSIIKATICFILVPMEQLSRTNASDDLAELHALGLTDRGIGYLIAVSILFVLVLDFALRLYIGRSAVYDGRRLKKKRFTYVVLAIIVAASLASNLMQRCIALGSNKVEIWANAMASVNVSVVVDITSLLALIEMIIAAIMVRRLRKELGISGKEAE
ncbi:MAG: hypothetical protein E7226_04595 [Clostridiales bacterium]|nr:hypothetical protein [Clostridiales bacterium]